MPKIISHPTISTVFLKDDVPYDKNLWEIYFLGQLKNNDFDNSTSDLRIGIKHIYRNEVLQTPTLLSSYVDSSNNPYTDLDSLLIELKSAIGDATGSSNVPSSTTGGVDGTNNRLDTVISEISNLNDTLTQQTNTVLEQIRDESVTQTAILNASNNLLNSIIIELQSLNTNTTDIENTVNTVITELQGISTQDSNFYSFLETRLNSIQFSLNTFSVDNNQNLQDIVNKVELLNGYTLGVQSLLSDIETALNNNSVVNVAKLEELRVILSNLDSNTDAIESELINIIAEHDQTQVAIANLQTSTSNFLSAIDIKLGLIRNFLDGAPRPAVLFKSTDGDSGTIVGVQNVSFTFSGTDDGQINGVEVPDGYSVTFVPNRGKDLIEEIDYQAPQDGFVIISYVANA